MLSVVRCVLWIPYIEIRDYAHDSTSNSVGLGLLLIVGADMRAGRVCPLVSHGEYAEGTDRQMPDRYITLSAIGGQHNKADWTDKPN